MIVKANVFPKLQIVQDLVKPLSRKHCFGTSFDSQHVKESQTLVNSAWKLFYHIFSSIWWELIWKISLLLEFDILGIIVNILTADDKYPVRDCENL